MIITRRFIRTMVPLMLALVVVTMCTASCAKRGTYEFAQQPLYATAISAQQEIDELMAFFQQWYRGEIPNTDAEFDRLDRVLHESFTIVLPEGDILTRSQVTSDFRRMYGMDDDALVWATGVRAIYTFGHLKVYRYEEHKVIGGEPSTVTSTVVFLRDGDAPNGLVWLRVHETGVEINN